MANLSAKIRLAAMVVTLLSISSTVQGTTINVRSKCSAVLTACEQAQGTGVSCFVLNNGDSHPLNVGTVWAGGVIWGLPGNNPDPVRGNLAKPQADLAEFTIGLNGQDFYDLSNVNAYNLPLEIHPTSGFPVNGQRCGSPSCTIPNLNSFCQPPNKLTGDPGDGCYNTDGPGPVATAGTRMFNNACPTAFSYSQDNSKTYTCNLGGNYEVVFCP